MKLPTQQDKAKAWAGYGDAVIRSQALGWGLTWTTHKLIEHHREVFARSISDADARLWGPTHQLEAATTVTQAARAHAAWERALKHTRLLEVFREIEQEGRVRPCLLDCVAGKLEAWEAVRDALAGAVLELKAVYPLALGGRPAPEDPPTQADRLI